jgi:hypothetical protein
MIKYLAFIAAVVQATDVPHFKINLSLEPEERFVEISKYFKD